MNKSLSNYQIVTIAVYLLGGDSRYVDTEDVAVKANELAPGRFTWRKYPDQINIHNVGAFLSDAKKPKNGNYLVGSEKKGWLLTENGHRFVRKLIKDLKDFDLSRSPISAEERRWRRLEKDRMLASPAFGKLNSMGENAITAQDAEAFFRVDDYVIGEARKRKVNRALNTFANDPDLSQAVKVLAKKVRNK